MYRETHIYTFEKIDIWFLILTTQFPLVQKL